MDGIIPLKPAASVPKPLDVLKNAIISENAEVLFDPIVPLPSPSKVRPKLRPVPRLGPHRRNSVQVFFFLYLYLHTYNIIKLRDFCLNTNLRNHCSELKITFELNSPFMEERSERLYNITP